MSVAEPSAAEARPALSPAASPVARPRASFYVPELDGLRFLAFLAVFCNHAFGPPSASSTGWWRIISGVLYGGGLGVDLFFALSGFLITSLLLREAEVAGRVRAVRFWGRRILRIWPLYYLALVVGIFVLPRVAPGFIITPAAQHSLVTDWGPGMALFFGNWLFVTGGWPPSPLLSPLWSISVEEQFYFVWPVVLALVGWRWALRFAVAAVVAAPLLRWTQLALTPPAMLHHPTLWTSTLAHVDVILLGCILAIVSERRPGWLARWTPGRALATGTVAAFAFAFLMYHVDLVIDVGNTVASCLVYSALAVTTTLLVGSAMRLPRAISAPLRAAPVVWLGRISYGLYVYHLGVLTLIGHTVSFSPTVAGLASSIGSAFLATVALGTVSYVAFERPFLLLKTRLATVRSRPV